MRKEEEDMPLRFKVSGQGAWSIEKTKVFRIEGRHEVVITYEVDACSADEAIRRLCNKGLFSDFSGADYLFGPDPDVMRRHGIRVIGTDCYEDPSPTGKQHVRREWDIAEEGG